MYKYPFVLVCLSCYNKVPQRGWLKTTGMYSLTVMKAWSLTLDKSKARCFQKVVGRRFLPLSAPSGCCQLLVYLHLQPHYSDISLCLTWLSSLSLCLCVYNFSFYKDNSLWIRDHKIQYDLVLINYIHKDSYRLFLFSMRIIPRTCVCAHIHYIHKQSSFEVMFTEPAVILAWTQYRIRIK